MTLTPPNNPAALYGLTPLVLVLASMVSPAWAQTTPDAGQILRNLQPPPAPGLPPTAAQPRAAEPALASQASQASVQVKAIRVTGNQEISSAALEPLVSGLPGKTLNLAQLDAVALRITAYYRAQGYPVARAYLPAQDITDGDITISIIEGRIASHRIRNQSRLSDSTASAYLAQVPDGSVIQSEQIDRSLLLLQDTPGVGGSRATLQPGASVGTSELLIELDPAQAFNASASLDNYGGRYTGEVRASVNASLASPMHLGEQLSLNLLTSGKGLSFGRLAYQLPLGSDGLKAGAAYFYTRYQLGQEFAALQAQGSATSTSVFAAYPLIRSQQKNLSGTASYEVKRLNDQIESTSTVTDKRVGVASLALSGNLQDGWVGGGISSAELTLALGSLRINSAAALALDAAAQTSGSYLRTSYSLGRLQRISDDTMLQLQLNGQWASKNLDSSEKFSLGGTGAVRAYPQGEASGDQGYRATLELRQALAANLQATVFYDWGSVQTNKSPFGDAAAGSNSRSLAGAGLGLNANFSQFELKAALAWRTRGGLPTSVPASAAKRPTLLLLAQVAF